MIMQTETEQNSVCLSCKRRRSLSKQVYLVTAKCLHIFAIGENKRLLA